LPLKEQCSHKRGAETHGSRPKCPLADADASRKPEPPTSFALHDKKYRLNVMWKLQNYINNNNILSDKIAKITIPFFAYHKDRENTYLL